MDEIAQLIGEYGHWFYVITFVWTFLEGETFVIFAGYAAEAGLISIWGLIACAWLGSFAGDQLYFFLGRRYGARLLERFPAWKPRVAVALDLLHHYNTGFILTFRFIYGVRNISSFAMGMSELAYPRFIILNFIAAGLWANAFAWFGYLFGKVSGALLGDYARDAGIALLVAFLVTAWVLVRRHNKRKQKAAPAD